MKETGTGGTIILTLLFLVSLSMYAQVNPTQTQRAYLPEIRVDSSFLRVLDCVLLAESEEAYYRKDTNFGISLFSDEYGSSCAQIEVLGRRVLKNGREIGIMVYKGHSFIFYGRKDDRIVKISTSTNLPFDFAVNQTQTLSDGTVLLDGVESDRFRIWIFRYENNDFRLIIRSGPAGY